MWKHKKIYKGKSFHMNAKYSKAGKRFYQLEDAKTGRELTKKYNTYGQAKADGWVRQ